MTPNILMCYSSSYLSIRSICYNALASTWHSGTGSEWVLQVDCDWARFGGLDTCIQGEETWYMYVFHLAPSTSFSYGVATISELL